MKSSEKDKKERESGIGKQLRRWGGILWVKTMSTLGENRWRTYGRLLTAYRESGTTEAVPLSLSLSPELFEKDDSSRLLNPRVVQSDCVEPRRQVSWEELHYPSSVWLHFDCFFCHESSIE